ncbi:AAA family ATPase [Muricomes intestini]
MKHKTLRRFVVLSGARRVGKTTIMYQLIDNLIFLFMSRLFFL